MTQATAFSKILIANRGEIALRVMRSAKALGYRTVAIYSSADRDALHVALADQAVPIGPAPVSQSYLSIEAILAACRASGADAVHPGYGFLSENAEFAQACAAAGLVFIGPDVAAIRLMGNKAEAKQRMLAAEVPCVPGYQGPEQSDAALSAHARRIGLPVMVKAAAGGGGRGMRLVTDKTQLAGALRAARAEAESAFGSGELLLEKALADARHVEIQVFADRHGSVIHLGERDCSIQRRYQKVIEEAPSPAVSTDLRARMGEAAVAAAQSIGYAGAGTVEFLLDRDGRFYFLEMNTRLQVEHPVTEAVTGLDLVEWQLRVAAGERLPLEQHQVNFFGHAMEARLYAEDPSRGFLPQAGKVLRWTPPQGAGVRVDPGIRSGAEISAFYDPMLAKIIAHGANREEARRRLAAALEDCVLLGIPNNKTFLLDCLKHPAFMAGEATTGFIPTEFPAESLAAPAPQPVLTLLAAALHYGRHRAISASQPMLTGWASNASGAAPLHLRTGEREHRLEVAGDGPHCCLVNDGAAPVRVEFLEWEPGRVRIALDGLIQSAHYAFDEERLYLQLGGREAVFENVLLQPSAGAAGAHGSGKVHAPMNGRIVAVHVAEGDAVARNQPLLVIESMKIQHEITAPLSGTVVALHARVDDQVAPRKLLAKILPA